MNDGLFGLISIEESVDRQFIIVYLLADDHLIRKFRCALGIFLFSRRLKKYRCRPAGRRIILGQTGIGRMFLGIWLFQANLTETGHCKMIILLCGIHAFPCQSLIFFGKFHPRVCFYTGHHKIIKTSVVDSGLTIIHVADKSVIPAADGCSGCPVSIAKTHAEHKIQAPVGLL